MAKLTRKEISATPPRVGRKQVNFDGMMARFPEGTFARIDAALKPGETRSDMLRAALNAELKRRES